MSLRTRIPTVAGLATAGLVVTAGAALAHPSFNPNQLTTGVAHEIDLVIPHGCTAGGGMPEEGEQTSPTTEIAVQLTDELVQFVPGDVDGWTTDADADVEAVVWQDAGGSTTDPITLPVTVEISTDVASGTDLYLTVAQTCEEGSILWAAGPGEDGSPAAVLSAGDMVMSQEMDHDGEMTDGEMADEEMADGEMADEEMADGEMVTTSADAGADGAAATSEDDGAPTGILLGVLGVLVVGGGAFALSRRGGTSA